MLDSERKVSQFFVQYCRLLVAKLIGRELASVPQPACTPSRETNFHHRLADLLARYNVNDYAASVRVLAVKP